MGDGLFDRFPSEVRAADDILGYSMQDLCLRDPEGKLDSTEYTQPALYVVNALNYLDRAARGHVPAYVAGHSLGEYNALFAAGAFDFPTGLRLVQRRGQIMAKASGGAMAAVVGLPEAHLREELERCGLHGLDIANLNSPTQIVISGPDLEVARAAWHLPKVGDVHVTTLRVSAAFHSRYMAAAAAEFLAFLRAVSFAPLRLPVLSNVHASPYEDGAVAETLAAQISSPVRWTEIVLRLLSLDGVAIEEVGPGRTLTALTRQIRRHASPREDAGDTATPLRKMG
jgi:trans-AT polyketide synthase/acyltransferase/oxidoreductase domain-containing protein